MDSLMTLALISTGTLLSIAMVAIGLGFVIFFHELGHFAVAKWCGVQVERFSIGFGPILWGRKWGETEYALSAVPFGGYVKMLGQDDIDPSQETSTEVAENPRSYTAKNVPQRMAIISAGVIMNIITGYLFYVGAMWFGIDVLSNEVGFVEPGMPAWTAGIRPDDVLDTINGRPVQEFLDVTRGTALSTGTIHVTGRHSDGVAFDVEVTPDQSGTKRMIGVGPQSSLKLRSVPPGQNIPVTMPGSPAARANGFQPGDQVVRIDDVPVDDFADLRSLLAERKGEALAFVVERAPADTASETAVPVTATIGVAPQPYRWLGLRMDIGEIAAVQHGSPAAAAGLKVDDRIIRVQSADDAEPLEVGRGIDPARLPDWFADRPGQTVKVTIERKGQGSQTLEFPLTPRKVPLWVASASDRPAPLEIPSIGVAFEFVPRVLTVEPDSPADKAGIKANDKVTKAEFVRPSDWPEAFGGKNIVVEVGAHGWANVIGILQSRPTWPVKLTLRPGGQEPTREVTLTSADAAGWFVASDRGLGFGGASKRVQAKTLGQACEFAWHQTTSSIMDIYLTLRGLFSGNISAKELHGPLDIFKMGMQIASAGVPLFLMFLAFLSVNLAVLNFLPIPVLDGGHMVFLIWEGLTRRKPNERVYATAMYLGLLFVLGLMVWVFYLDISRWMD